MKDSQGKRPFRFPQRRPPTDQTKQQASTSIVRRSLVLLTAAVFCGMLSIYLFTVSENYSPDAMSFAVQATRGDLTLPLFFQAEHLLYPFAGWLWYLFWVFFGYDEGALIPMQLLNAMFGAAGAAVFFLAMRLVLGRAQRSVFISLVAALTLGVSYAYWFHSTEAEDQIAANALAIGAFLATLFWLRFHRLRREESDAGDSRSAFPLALMGVLAGAAVLFHATYVLFLPVLGAGLYWGRATRREWAVGVAAVAVVVAIPYLLVGSLAHGFRSPGDYLTWSLSAPGHGVWGQLEARNLWQALQTLAGSIVYQEGGLGVQSVLEGGIRPQSVVAVLVFLVVIGVVLLSAGYLFYHRRHLTQRTVVMQCALWAGLFALFNVYWAPEDLQFWVPVLAPLILLATVAYVHLLEHFPRREELLHSVTAFALATIFVVNLVTAVVPRARLSTNIGYYKALCAGGFAGQGDLIVAPGWDWASSYVPYFTGREVFSLVDVSLLVAGRDQERLVSSLRERVEHTYQVGGRVFVVRLLTLSESDRVWLRRVVGLEVEDFPYRVHEVGRCGDEPIWEVDR